MKKYKSLLSTILAAVFLFTSIFVQYGTAFAENKNDENSKLYKEIQAQKAIPEASREVKELSAKVYGVMKLKDKYSKMDDEEKKLVESYFNVRGDVLEKCEERGYSLVDSINRGAISIRYDLTLDEVEQLLSAKGNIQNLAAEFAKYKSLVEKYNFSDTEAIEARELILKGFSVDGLRDAYIVSRALGINIKEIAFKAEAVHHQKAMMQRKAARLPKTVRTLLMKPMA